MVIFPDIMPLSNGGPKGVPAPAIVILCALFTKISFIIWLINRVYKLGLIEYTMVHITDGKEMRACMISWVWITRAWI